MPCGHLLVMGLPLGSRLWYLNVSLTVPICILGKVWYLILSIPDLCTLTYFVKEFIPSSKTPVSTGSRPLNSHEKLKQFATII